MDRWWWWWWWWWWSCPHEYVSIWVSIDHTDLSHDLPQGSPEGPYWTRWCRKTMRLPLRQPPKRWGFKCLTMFNQHSNSANMRVSMVMGVPPMNGRLMSWKSPICKWIFLGYRYWKPPYVDVVTQSVTFQQNFATHLKHLWTCRK